MPVYIYPYLSLSREREKGVDAFNHKIPKRAIDWQVYMGLKSREMATPLVSDLESLG